ncbi:prenyltransferase and squalene oxidase repeat family protein [Cryptosporidium andersoni]|uniref:Protein farnesyltransferase subunit beta n=1 Tax=Cryptosporidium andersoni TaxID=117008 RepID=A0A1J4MD03_9CRYT|nr:prenyltransferase and squalene oxidase repeat family protein [Cryptosporidium andersoni]
MDDHICNLFLTEKGIYPWYIEYMGDGTEGESYKSILESVRNNQICYQNFVSDYCYSDMDEYEKHKTSNIINMVGLKKYKNLLYRDEHLEYVRQMRLRRFPISSASNEASRVLIIYWSVHSEELLETDYNYNIVFDDDTSGRSKKSDSASKFVDSDKIIATILSLQYPEGGFCGNFSHMPNIVSTYAAVCSLIIVGDTEALGSIDRIKMYQYLKSLRDSDTGGFQATLDGEVDIRVFYCVVAIASMLHLITDELFEKIDDYILSCVAFDGGFCGEQGGESHGAYTYCAVAGVCILGKSYLLDLENLIYWTTQRQSGVEGGFQGRTNKLIDSCYSFWFTGLLYCLKEVCRVRSILAEKPFNHVWCDYQALQSFLLVCCQSPAGGFRDKPGLSRDMYHTCYALSGLSLAQKMAIHMKDSSDFPISSFESLGSPSENFSKYSDVHTIPVTSNDLINPTDPFLNIRPDKIIQARRFLANDPLILTDSGEIGIEGKGYRDYIEHHHYSLA